VPEDTSGNYLFDRPGLYQIRVVGILDECWLEHLEGLEISVKPWRNYYQVTQISGWLADQTVLSGLLDLLTDLSMVILSVERLEMDETIEKSHR
jgi:hypothetical protein